MATLIIALGLMFVGAAVAALIAKWLKQPFILGYVVAGLILGPAVTGLIDDPEPVALLSELGLIFLMFIIGLELDLSKIKDVGSVSILIGILQVVLTAGIGALASVIFGFTFVQGLYLGLLISFSSTLVVVKILVDRKELSSLHGSMTLSILVVQDILAVLGLSLLGALEKSQPLPGGLPTMTDVLSFFGFAFPQTGLGLFFQILFGGVLFAVVVWLFFKLIVPTASQGLSASNEIYFALVLASVFFVAMLAGFFEFSFAIGAFVAGVALSSSFHSHDIIGRVKPLRDFFLILFFVSLGLQVMFEHFISQFFLILFLLVGGLVLKPVITFFLLKLFRYNNRTAFIVSLHLAQIGEFGLILVSAGVLSGALPPSIMTGTVLATIFTMTLTAYMMKYDEHLYLLFRPYMEPLAIFFGSREEERRSAPKMYQPDAVIFGVNTMTAGLIELLGKQKHKLLLVDASPHNLTSYKQRGVPVICADATNDELYETTDFSKAALVITTLTNQQELLVNQDTNTFLIHKIKAVNKDVIMIATAESEDWGRRLYRAGATIVLVPSVMGRKFLSHLLEDGNFEHLRVLGKEYEHELQKQFAFLRRD